MRWFSLVKITARSNASKARMTRQPIRRQMTQPLEFAGEGLQQRPFVAKMQLVRARHEIHRSSGSTQIQRESMNRHVRNVFFALLSIAALSPFLGVASAQVASEALKKVRSIEGITEYRLQNGLRVLLFPDPTRPKLTVNLTVLVGSRHEGYGETGMAHLLEHMLFKGTPTHRDIPSAMKERGAQFNGSTWLDRTNYFETLPDTDQNLEFAIRLEADRMINSPIKAEDLATEFSVVRNEFEMGENSPERVLSQRMMSVAYEWHNYGKSTIGNRSDIERVPVDNLRAFYKKFYQPDNAVLVVAGRFDEKKALEYITKYFGSLPRPDRKLQETYTEEPRRMHGERSSSLCGASATWVWSECSFTYRPPRTSSSPPWSSWATSSIPSPPVGL